MFDRDIDAIIRTHARDRRVAAWLQDTAQSFEDIGEIGWARQATDHHHDHQALQAAASCSHDTAPAELVATAVDEIEIDELWSA